jgi:hypothetical protein
MLSPSDLLDVNDLSAVVRGYKLVVAVPISAGVAMGMWECSRCDAASQKIDTRNLKKQRERIGRPVL